jgi:hypothetical protein
MRNKTPDSLLPTYVSHPIAARILSVSEARLAQLAESGAIQAHGRTWRLYKTSDLAFLLNRPITCEDYLRADRAHDGRRAQAKACNDRARGFTAETAPAFLRRIVCEFGSALLDNHRLKPRSDGGSGAPAQPAP